MAQVTTLANIQPADATTGNQNQHFLRSFSTCLILLVSLLPASLAQNSVVLVGSGSSVPAPLYTKLAEEFDRHDPGVQMRYLSLSTAEGINQIAHGNGDFAAGEAPLTPKQRAEASLIEIPSILVAIVPIYNLPSVLDLRFSGVVLADIFMGNIKTWNDAQIAKLNPGVALPDLPIKVVYRPGGKGSNYVFSEFLTKSSPRFRSQIGTSMSPNWPVGVPAERSIDMAEKVKNEPGAIGYVEHAYAVKGRIQQAAVLNAERKFVKASPATIAAACHAIESPRWNKFSASLTNAPGTDSFPITSFSWLYLRAGSRDSRRMTALKNLLNWMFSSGQQLAANEGYSALPPALIEKVKARINSLQ